MNEYQVRVYFASGRMSYNIGTLIKGDYNSSKLVFDFDDDTGIKMFELLKPDGETKWIKEIVNNEIILADTDELGEVIPLLTQEGTYIFEVAKYDGNSKLTSVKGKFKVKDEQVSTSDIPLEEVSKVELDDLINDVAKVVEEGTEATANTIEQANYAKEQGDYAKEQAQIIIDANTTATKIINDFETNVSGYTRGFNTNAEEKLEAYNQNDIDKTKAYNENAESKEKSYNENASNKLKEYNDNATTKLSEYNSNSETKTTTFNTNASEKTGAFNLNATNKIDDFNSNVEAKTTEFNNNATTKTEEYNTNAEAKVNEFNATVDELKQDVEDCYNNMLTNEVEGTTIHVEDSANARILALESEGNCEQVSTTGTSLLDFANPYTIINSELSFENDVLTLTTATTKTYDGVRYNILDLIKANVGKTLRLDFESISETNTLSGTAIGSLALAVNGTNVYHTFIGNSSANYVPAIAYYTIPEDVSGITSAVLNIFTNNSSSRPDVSNKVVIKKPILHFGKEKVDYEPYTGGQPSPSPDYPHEVEVIEAYNLFDKDNADILTASIDSGNGKINAANYSKTLYLEIPDNTDNITISRISGKRFVAGTFETIPSIDTACINFVTDNTAKSITIPVASNAKYLAVYYYLSTLDTLSEQEILDSIQVVKGPKVKKYQPCKCIRYKYLGESQLIFSKYTTTQSIKSFDFTNDVLTVEATGDGTFPSVFYDISDLYKDNPNEHLKFSYEKAEQTNTTCESAVQLEVTYNNGSKKYPLLVYNKFATNVAHQIVADTSDVKSVRLQLVLHNSSNIAANKIIITKPILHFGQNAVPYTPHQENDLDINLQGNFKGKIGDVADTLRVENGRAILTKRIGKVILDGSENWSYDQVYAIFSSNVLIGAKDDKEVINTLSDRFVSVSYNNRGGDFARIYANNSWVAIRGVKQTTVDEFKIWLQANPMTVYYVLTEPYEVDLGEVTMPKTYEGVTNISMIANLESNMKLKYVRSTNIVVDNLAKAIVALGGEV